MVYLPPSCSAEEYAEHVADLRRMREEAGKDPETLIVFGAMATVVGDTERRVDEACGNAAMRWDAASLVPHPGAYERMTGKPNPLGDWSYPRDLIPMQIPRERALEIADQFQPYIDAGMTHVLIADYCGLVSTGSYSEAESSTAVADLVTEIRKRNPDKA
jgi:alkanesulfonate monooxygenase SsuD/methylene tetrahydromethanopterin reductase-like flavin-dependent oxidoreductase (luciferase family)